MLVWRKSGTHIRFSRAGVWGLVLLVWAAFTADACRLAKKENAMGRADIGIIRFGDYR